MVDLRGTGDGPDAVGGPLDEIVASALVDAAPDAIVMVDEQGQILLVNRQMEQLFGYGRAELIGQDVELLLPEALRQSHRAHRTRFRAEPRTRSMGAGLALFGRRRDGAQFPVEISLSPLRTDAGLRVIAAVRDITERLLAEAEAREIRRVVDATRDAVLMFDRDTLRFTYVNQGAIDQLGYSRDELFAMTPLHIKPALTEAEYRALIAGLAPGQSYTYTTVHRRKDGRDIVVEAVLQHPAEDRPGGSVWMVSIARDMTDRLEAERRTQEAERGMAVLEDRQRIARDLHDRVIQRLFAAGLGIEAISGRVLDPLAAERLRHIVADLDDTIRELRSSIFELGSVAVAHSLRAKVIDVCSEERTALGFDPSVRFEGPVDTIEQTLGDQVLSVLREALSNVARHAHASSTRVSVVVGDHLVLRVEDDGIGLGDAPHRQGGNGLGNMAARAEKLGGTCDLKPASPSGTTLEWRVPVA